MELELEKILSQLEKVKQAISKYQSAQKDMESEMVTLRSLLDAVEE
jgi:hypothetical protein